MAAVVVMTTAVVVATAGPAEATPLANIPLITFNMQGASSGGDSKWTTTVAGYAQAAEIVALQEAGPMPPGRFVENIDWNPQGPGRSGYVQHHRWSSRGASYEVYFLQTDANGGAWSGGRTNIALVTQREADEVHVEVNTLGGRHALGVRFGDNWYFTFHGLSTGGRPNDSSQMAAQINSFVRRTPNRTWTMVGDFNAEPGTFFQPAQTWRYNPGTATHQGGGELDWALSSENIPNHPVHTLPGASSDHYAVAIGTMRAAAQPPQLRIMPLGDSITFGANTSMGAYRAPLWDKLKQQQNTTVDYVGSQHYGLVPDNANEGHPGWKIDDLAGIVDQSLNRYKPNLVLLHIGTNDMNENVDVGNAPRRLGNLIDQVFRDLPDATLIVSTLVPAAQSSTEERIFHFNHSIPEVVAQRQDAGKHVWMVDMGSVTTGDLSDLLHPNDTGYRKMADVFYQGIQAVEQAGWIAAPPAVGNPGGGPPKGWLPEGTIASGTMHSEAYPGNLSLGGGDQVRFADLNGDRRADYLVTHDNGVLDIWFNGGFNTDGTIDWARHETIDTRNNNARWFFGDVFYEGRDQVIQIYPRDHPTTIRVRRSDGSSYAQELSKIMGSPMADAIFADIYGSRGVDWIWPYQDTPHHVNFYANFHMPQRSSEPWHPAPANINIRAEGDGHRFSDLTGDGLADYLRLNDDGSVEAYSNRRNSPWNPQGTVMKGVGTAGSRIQFADLDGDKKADYLDVEPVTGSTRMWRNDYSEKDGSWNWTEQGSVTTGNAQRVTYADINGDKRADYLQIGNDSSVRAWLNGGPNPGGGDWYWIPQDIVASGVGKPGANIRFADINNDGKADYLVVNPDGSVQAWINGGEKPGGGDYIWYPQGTIASGVGEPGGSVRLADINADGRTDYLIVRPNSATKAWINGGEKPGGGDYIWYPQETIASGVGAPGREVRFADFTGDKRADYLLLHDNSAVDMWQNGGANPAGGDWYWIPVGTTASGVLVPGSRIQFADLNADGRDDYIDVDPVTGATRAWANVG